jgi:hypothetical protein
MIRFRTMALQIIITPSPMQRRNETRPGPTNRATERMAMARAPDPQKAQRSHRLRHRIDCHAIVYESGGIGSAAR